MSEWQDISTAPKNPAGSALGPWVLVWSQWDHGIYMARWEAKGDHGSWKAKRLRPGPEMSEDNVTHWMLPPGPPQ